MWSDEIVASFKGNLVVANVVSEIPHMGKKGDTIHVPNPTRAEANAKVEATAVKIISNVESKISFTIDEHWEYTRLIEDIANVQAINTYRSFYTDDAGFSLATRTDRELWKRVAELNSGTVATATALFETAVIGSDGTTVFSGVTPGNGTALSDAGLRRIIQTLDDADTPMMDRVLVIPPVEKNSLSGIPRFTEQAFVGEGGGANTIRNGLIGELYGVNVYVSTQCPYIHVNSVTSTQSVTFTSTAPTGASFADDFGIVVDWNTSSPTDAKFRAAVMMHKSAIVHIPQMGVRAQTQYKQEFLADLFTADVIFDTGVLRNTAGVGIVVPA